MTTKLDKIVKTYKSLTQIPDIIGARVVFPGLISTTWSQRNLERGTSTKFNSSIILDNLQKVGETFPVDVSSEVLSAESKSQKIKAIVKDADSKQFLEVWLHNKLTRVVDLAALDVHGAVYADREFGVLEFSPDETKLLYVAEKKLPKSEPFYKRKKPDEPSEASGDDPAKVAPKGEEYLFIQDWGEQLVGKKQSVLAQYDIQNDTVTILKGIPESVCVAQPKYSPDGAHIVGISYFTEPRKLGLIYCSNRLSTIFQLDFDGNYLALPLEKRSVKCPIFSPDGSTLLWLEREADGPHHSCLALVKTDFPLKKDAVIKTVVDIVPTEKVIEDNRTFYGIYATGFAKRPWIGNDILVVNTSQKYTVNSYAIDIGTGKMTELVFDDGSQFILDVKDNLILALRRNFLIPDRLYIGKIPDNGALNAIEWHQITVDIDVPEIPPSTYKYLELIAPEGDVREFNAIYIGPKSGNEKEVPLVLWPHGGPHSAFANYFILEVSVFLSLGYALLLVNYRGSIGAGKKSVDFLPGNVGTSDVQDCIQAVDTALKEFPWINPTQLALCGGSHGGFLVAHLSGQYPDKFKSVVARNPVIDVASMSLISDIPDWCYVEGGEPYTQKGRINDELLMKMRQASPIVHAHKVKAPTLLQIGAKDLRVPPHQGADYYYRLKANGVETRMNLYEDNHPLGSVANEMDNIINTILWTEKHLGRN